MGLRNGAYATVWDITPMSDSATKIRCSVSKKNKDTQTYEQDFSGFVIIAGTGAAQKAAHLNKGDRIRFGDIEAKTKYVKEKNMTYYNFYAYGFYTSNEEGYSAQRQPGSGSSSGYSGYSQRNTQRRDSVDSGMVDDSETREELPW